MSVEKIPFKISTGLKDIIGKELITDDDIAIFELVKNSYDAYAKNVKIIFKNLSRPQGSKDSKIIIVDDGYGMSRNDIEDKWLFVGYSEKKPQKKLDNKTKSYRDKIKQKRVFAGAKGIGRFSADRLGDNLTLYSKRKNEKQINKLEINWKDFEDVQDSEFKTIMTKYSPIPTIPKEIHRTNLKQGTVLEISGLHDKWTREKLLKLKRYLQRLINPSSEQKNKDFSIEIISDEMKESDKNKKDYERVNGTIDNFVFEKLGIKTTQISSELKDGMIKTSIIDKGQLVVEFEEENKYGLLHNVRVHLFYLNSDAKRAFTSIMGVQPVKYGSVFLYRNGFRVYSYGDEGNDWLGLERRKGQGYARFLSTRELMGRIEILEQSAFKELSSRSEGLVKSPNYFQLVDFFIDGVLKRLEKYVVEGLKWDAGRIDQQETNDLSSDVVLNIVGKKGLKNIRLGKNLRKIIKEKQGQQIPEFIKNFEYVKKYIKSKEERNYVDKQIKKVKSFTKTLAKERNEYKQKYEVKKYEALFLDKALSSDKDHVINLVHSIKISSQSIDNAIYKIHQKIKDGAGISDIEKFLDKISIENQKINRVSKIVTSANFDLLSNTIEVDIVEYIKQYLEIGSDKDLEDVEIVVLNGDIKFESEFQPIEIAVIFDNFVSNASKAAADTMTILFEKQGRNLRMLIGDDGDGISESDQKLLFTRGFSSRKKGSGLGLHYIKSLVTSMGGKVKFIGNDVPDMGKGACFEVILH